jgi:hypothetical protein
MFQIHCRLVGHRRRPEHPGSMLDQLPAPLRHLVRMHAVPLRNLSNRLVIAQRFDRYLGL